MDQTNKFEYIIKENDKELRIKELLKRNFGFSSRLMTKLKVNDCVCLNDITVKMYEKGNAGDIITVRFPKENSHFEPENITDFCDTRR